jgi:hypothetical protein
MAAPLILRIITDATQTLRMNNAVISSNTLVGKSALDMGADIAKTAKTAVTSSVAMEESLAKLAAEYRSLSTSAALSGKEQVKAAQLAELTNARLARSQGLVVAGTGGMSRGAKTAEADIGKLTRGALAGSGVISTLGRSLAFASTGFIVVAGTATLLHSAITEALGYAAAEKQVTAQLKTGGLSFQTYKSQIEDALTAESKLSGFTRQDLLQSFGYLVRVSGKVGQSLNLDSVAADVARGRHIALSSASIALAKALGGSSTALRRLGIIVPKTATGMDAIRYVAAKFAGQAEAGATSADHLHASLANAGEVIGTSVLPTFNRLTGEFSDYLTKLDQTGRLQRDVGEGVTILGIGFHALGSAIKVVDDATGGFTHTIAILIALELGSKVYGWVTALRVLAGEWGLVGAAATAAGEAQVAAVATSGAAGVAGGGAAAAEAGAGGIGGLFAGGLLGQVAGSRVRGFFASRAAASELAGVGAEGGAAAGVSATGVGALAVAAVLATDALGGLAKKVNEAAGGGSTGNSIINTISGVLSGGLVGDYRFGVLGQALHGFPGYSRPKPPPPPAYLLKPPYIPQQFQVPGVLGQAVTGQTGPFGTAQPMQQFWKTFGLTLKQQMAEAQAALTKSNKDDIAAARQEIARIKQLLDEGRLKGPALFMALQMEATDLSTIWSAEAAAAQKRAAAAAAAKQKIITQIQNAIDPIKLEVGLSKAQALGQSTVPALKALLSAAYKGLAKAIANGNQQLIKQAYDQITSLKQQIQQAQTAVTKTFTEPMRLQIALARAQAFGKDDTKILEEMKAAAIKALKSGKFTGQSLIDLLNEIASINSQLNSSVTNAYGDYKKASLKAETAGLGLTRAQRDALEARLSQRGPGGTVPETGTGAAGYVIDPKTGRPVRVKSKRRHLSGSTEIPGGAGGSGRIYIDQTIRLNLNIDGKHLTTVVTRGQQSYRKSNPSSRRGPHAGTPTA